MSLFFLKVFSIIMLIVYLRHIIYTSIVIYKRYKMIKISEEFGFYKEADNIRNNKVDPEVIMETDLKEFYETVKSTRECIDVSECGSEE